MPSTEEIEEVEQTEEEREAEYDKAFYGEVDDEPEVDEESVEEDEPDTDGAAEDELPEPEGDAEDDESTEEEGEPEGDPEAGELVTLKWRGKEIQVTQAEAIAMAQQNFDVTHKYQEVAKMRKSIESEMGLIERVKAGDKDALAQLAKQGNIDPVDLLDIDMDAIEQGSSDQEEPFVSPEVDVLMKEVAKDETLFDALSDIEKTLPSSVVDKMAKDPEAFYTIVNEVRSGDAEIVMPQVQARLSTLDSVDRAVVMGSSDAFANFYMNVKQSMIDAQQPIETTPTAPAKRVKPTGVSVQKSKQTTRSTSGKLDSFQSDAAYEKILERLNAAQ